MSESALRGNELFFQLPASASITEKDKPAANSSHASKTALWEPSVGRLSVLKQRLIVTINFERKFITTYRRTLRNAPPWEVFLTSFSIFRISIICVPRRIPHCSRTSLSIRQKDSNTESRRPVTLRCISPKS